uniref:Secreted protein n=1 Tax=Haemonchus contortus TaxID=6289 RepID=A0A7I4YP11_HAECO
MGDAWLSCIFAYLSTRYHRLIEEGSSLPCRRLTEGKRKQTHNAVSRKRSCPSLLRRTRSRMGILRKTNAYADGSESSADLAQAVLR